MLTKKQKNLLIFINKKIRSSGVSPSYEEMKNSLNLKSKSGIHRLISALEERGFVKRLAHKARALEVIKLPENASANDIFNTFTPSVIKGGLDQNVKKSSDISNPENIHILSASDLIKLKKKNNFVSLIIGPEGGFSIDELLFSYLNKFSFICLGGRILRMETVPIALISILQSIFGDF